MPGNIQDQVDKTNEGTAKAEAAIAEARAEMATIVDELKALTDELESSESMARSTGLHLLDLATEQQPAVPFGTVLLHAHLSSQEIRTAIRSGERRFGYLSSRVAVNQGIIDRNRAKLGRWSQMWPGIQSR